MRKVLLLALLLSSFSSCANRGFGDEKNSIRSIISGSTKIQKSKNSNIINILRAIGAPANITSVNNYKYYKWGHNRNVGVSTIIAGGSYSLYCDFTAETFTEKIGKNLEERVTNLAWQGTECDTYIDAINSYYSQNLNDKNIIPVEDKSQDELKVMKEKEISEIQKDVKKDDEEKNITTKPEGQNSNENAKVLHEKIVEKVSTDTTSKNEATAQEGIKKENE
jgi:hypothetical protein